jgi:hypothetical protein
MNMIRLPSLFINMAVRRKIVLVFATMLVLTGRLGAMSLIRAAQTNGTVQELTGRYIVAMIQLNKLRSDLNQIRGMVTRTVTTAADKAAFSTNRAAIATALRSYQDDEGKYERLVVSAEELKLL